MTCHEFAKQVEAFTPAELSHSARAELLAHQRECTACNGLLQRKVIMLRGLQLLRSSTASLEAPVDVERNVLRAFRQGAAGSLAPELPIVPQANAFLPSRYLGWQGFAAAAAGLALCLGLGLWFLLGSGKTAGQSAQRPTASAQQPTGPSVEQPEHKVAELREVPTPAGGRRTGLTVVNPDVTSQSKAADSSGSLVQAAQAQGYTPLMLCDPLSCSGDEQVVRLELPATSADGSTASQMADVIVGDDGLVRAIRIVQQ